jgi:hypothetical protein
VATVKRGLKRGLDSKGRSVLLMLDETIITETPPLYSAYGHVGVQVRVPITGNCQWTRIVTRLVNPNCYEA